MGWLDSLRNFADPGNQWLEGIRDGQWIDIGNAKLLKAHPNVSYSKESCCFWGNREIGNQTVFFVLRSIDLNDQRIHYFAVSISMDKGEARVYLQRSVLLDGKFTEQKSIGPQTIKTETLHDLMRNFSTIDKLSMKNHYYPGDENTWVGKMMDLLN